MASRQLKLADFLKRSKSNEKEDKVTIGTEKTDKTQTEHSPQSHEVNVAVTDKVTHGQQSERTERGRKRKRKGNEGKKYKKRLTDSEGDRLQKQKLYEQKRVREFNESWKKVYNWLEYEKEKNIMYCKFCREFPRLADQKSNLFTGAGKFREETLKFHNKSKCHNKCSMEWEKIHVRAPGSAPLEKAVKLLTSKLSESSGKRMKILFNTAYYVAKQNIAFLKFASLCELQEKNGLDAGSMYKNADKCREFVSCIAKVESQNIENSIKNSRFISVLSDGSTDSAVMEQETVFVRYVDKTGNPCTDFVDIVPLESANHADGVLSGILKALGTVNISIDTLKQKLVGCNFDGASVMMGKTGGVAVKLQQKVEHDIVKIHCVAHNLELGVLDSVKTVPYLKKFQDTINQIYKFYYYSPKRRREMRSIAEIIDEMPVAQTGLQKTRWVASRHRAIQAVIQSLPTIVVHFQNSAAGKGEEAAKVKGYLKEVCSEKFLHFAHFMCDVLSILAELSKQLQSETLTINDVGTKLEMCLLKLEELKHSKGPNYTHFLTSYDREKAVLSCGKESTIEVSKSLMNFENEFKVFLDKTIDYCGTRFKSLQEIPIVNFSVFDHKVWPTNRADLAQYGNDNIDSLCGFFSPLLSEDERNAAQEEWLELKVRLNRQRSVQPLEILSSLLQSKPESLTNILLLVEIMLTLSPSTAKCERSFSSMKRIKTNFRNSLTQESLRDLMKVASLEASVTEFDCSEAIAVWLSATKSSRHAQRGHNPPCSQPPEPIPSQSASIAASSSTGSYLDLPLPPEVADI